MEPRFDNKVTLDTTKDQLGQFELCVNYSLSDREIATTIALHSKVDSYLKEKNLGSLNSNFQLEKNWPLSTDASHHCGGTIMGHDSQNSFVNENLRVHSIDNLYIASSSVMPTSGSHNPTFTIAALTCLLADRFTP